jgi:3,4-dihydroxy-2-butanone 4-phosphate synthase
MPFTTIETRSMRSPGEAVVVVDDANRENEVT